MDGDALRLRDRLERHAMQLHAAGRLGEALPFFEQLAAHDPSDPRPLVNLGYLRFHLGMHSEARDAYLKAIALDPRHVQAHHGMSAVLAAAGDRAGSAEYLIAACRLHPVRIGAFRGEGRPVRVLELLSAGAGNLNSQQLLDDRTFLVTELFVDCIEAGTELPPHDVIFNAIGDADAPGPALSLAAGLIERSTAPVVNPVAAVLRSSRGENAQRFGSIAGIRTPHTIRCSKRALVDDPGSLLASGLCFPLLLRSVGFHNGEFFELVPDADSLAASATALPGEELYAIEFLDVRSADGKVRKYRVMIIGDAILPLHAAVSRAWKVHYVTADMDEVAEHRAEDERFLADMESVLGKDAIVALHEVRAALGLEYAGIDFSLGGNGEVVVFEANATMLVPAVPGDPRWSYRLAPTRRIIDRFAQMLTVSSR